MSQVSETLRKTELGYAHWCPGCNRMHALPEGWTFDGNLEEPTFTPSFKHTMAEEKTCHYTLTKGVLSFCSDSTHSLAGQKVHLPTLAPFHMADI